MKSKINLIVGIVTALLSVMNLYTRDLIGSILLLTACFLNLGLWFSENMNVEAPRNGIKN